MFSERLAYGIEKVGKSRTVKTVKGSICRFDKENEREKKHHTGREIGRLVAF